MLQTIRSIFQLRTKPDASLEAGGGIGHVVVGDDPPVGGDVRVGALHATERVLALKLGRGLGVSRNRDLLKKIF